MQKRKVVLCLLLCATISEPLLSAELTPYRLPSDLPNRAQQVPVEPQRTAPDRDDFYKTFEQKTRGLSKNDKQKLIDEFLEKQKAATNPDEEYHYFRLIKILKRGGSK